MADKKKIHNRSHWPDYAGRHFDVFYRRDCATVDIRKDTGRGDDGGGCGRFDACRVAKEVNRYAFPV